MRSCGSSKYVRGLQEHVRDVILFYAALIGTDYNTKGLATFGKEKAKSVTHLIYEHWLQCRVSGKKERGFLDYALLVVGGHVDVPHENKTFSTFLRKAGAESRPGCTFATELNRVIKIVDDQRAKASDTARRLRRDDVAWTGASIDHQQLIKVLLDANVEQAQENGVNGVLSRVMKIEAERTLRAGEASTRRPLLCVDGIVKPKEVKKWSQVLPKLASTALHMMYGAPVSMGPSVSR